MATRLSAAMIQIRLPKEILKRLDKIAEGRLISRSDVVREALLMYLATVDSDKSPFPSLNS